MELSSNFTASESRHAELSPRLLPPPPVAFVAVEKRPFVTSRSAAPVWEPSPSQGAHCLPLLWLQFSIVPLLLLFYCCAAENSLILKHCLNLFGILSLLIPNFWNTWLFFLLKSDFRGCSG